MPLDHTRESPKSVVSLAIKHGMTAESLAKGLNNFSTQDVIPQKDDPPE